MAIVIFLATAAQLNLATSTTDDVTMVATGNSSIADSLVLVNKTSALNKITINDVLDTQNNVSGNE